MSEPKLISPMLDNFEMGDPISDHHGVRCCPAMEKDSNEKYIVKIISIPASQTQLDALLLTGAYPDAEAALGYFKQLTDDVAEEVQTLNRLSQLEGFLPFTDMQIQQMEDETGYDVYLISPYKKSLQRNFSRQPMTHLAAVNLGLDLCAAMSACRRSGYICVDIKPSNIFISDENEYRIGDLGFMRLDSLKYASLPDKYRSEYTAPEYADPLEALNTTIDIYAAGLVLYQAYNGGILPAFDGTTELSAPAYADYEMAEIILKACATNPADRWEDPAQMGQALVSYMQRNGANDTPIIPVAGSQPEAADVPEEHEVEETTDVEAPVEEEAESDAISVAESEAEEANEPSEEIAEEVTEDAAEEVQPEGEFIEDIFGNLSFLDLDADETSPDYMNQPIAYEELSDEVSSMLSQADDLASHPIPAPVVAPEPIEVPMPELIIPEEEEANAPEEEEDPLLAATMVLSDTNTAEPESKESTEDTAVADDGDDEYDDDYDEDDEYYDDISPSRKKSYKQLIATILIIFASLALLIGGAYYFINYYLQSISNIRVEGSEDGLIVYVDSQVDESLLTVSCSDAYGNKLTAPVINGKATFTSLVPNTGYNINVMITGFHKLTGKTSTAYSTPVQTNIVQFTAITGSESGSVILNFRVDGPDSEQWEITYSALGEEEKTEPAPSRMVTITGLTVGKEYTFTLSPKSDLYVTGTNQIKHVASELIVAEELTIVSCSNNQLTASWKAPVNSTVDTWTVRCYNDSGYNETKITAQTTVVFENLDHTKAYTVEVTAAGMSVQQRTYLTENTITVTDMKADASNPKKIVLTWEANGTPKNGWVLFYSLVGSETRASITCTENRVVIDNDKAGGSYEITLQQADGSAVLGTPFYFTFPAY